VEAATKLDEVVVREMTASDWPAVRDIYASGISTGDATFETEPPNWDRFEAAHRPDLCLVAVGGGDVVIGWVAAGPVSDRHVYRGVVEHSVYVHPAWRGRGVGRLLLTALIELTERLGIWSIRSGMFPENEASRALHLACGFRVIGTLERVGEQGGRWRDVVLLERRSTVVGTG
jgi:L-amino acid N-acyltransferase YncA